MTDKELLELAAKAAKYDLHYGHDKTTLCKEDGYAWNPLADDGDALRLAVNLGIDLTLVRRAIVRTAAEIGKDMK